LKWSKVVSCKNRKYGGFLLAEMIVAFTVLGMLIAGLALSLHAFAKFNHYQLLRQQCIAATQAQLDSIAATGKLIPDEDFSRLWPRLSVSMEKTPGAGQWQGTKLAEVTVSGKSFRKEVKIQLSRYIPGDEPAAEGK
jgi:type II secretory pathway pseudopilin PulG